MAHVEERELYLSTVKAFMTVICLVIAAIGSMLASTKLPGKI